ncbi:hypothetical protein OVA03_04605 [Asticcacaulis sp. SL142]|uniref:hypothetical protein n=1 Tax=Asticcacaulis sp. SL142 TaxID=2995155 RepID=UPI00226D1123|nr:hypothetical protein [Asticcacaulis sp. SL142]WAC49199.1 hypothetical protein OVA03_04605 [Asticcacaulis sp. SL142]
MLTKLKPDYLLRQFGAIAPDIVREIVLMSVNLARGGNWKNICDDLQLAHSASLQDVRDAILTRSIGDEYDQRVVGAARTALAHYFEELTGFDDDLLTDRGNGANWSTSVDQAIAQNPLERYFSLLTENVLLREERTAPTQAEADAIRAEAKSIGADMAARLRARFEKSGDAGDARVLARATREAEQTEWFLKRLRA